MSFSKPIKWYGTHHSHTDPIWRDGTFKWNSWQKWAKNKNKPICLKDSVTRFFATGLFHESVFPQPQSIPLGPFRIFSKIRGDIRMSRGTTSINDTGRKQWEKNQTADTLKWTWRQKFIYMYYVNSTIQRCPNKIIKNFLIEDFFSFAGGEHWAANISAIFRKISKRP